MRSLKGEPPDGTGRAAISRRDFLGTGVALAAATAWPGGARWLFEPHDAGARTALELPFASAREAARAIRRREVSSVELTEHLLDRVRRYEPALNAFTTVLEEEALGRAREADEALRRGRIRGPLHGVPVSVKEAFSVEGVRTTAGAPFLSDHVPERDAVAVRRLRASGAVILGHTNVPVLLGDYQTYNDLFGTTNNPWDTERTPGGSTGGGAAAVAAGLSFLSLGSDFGGSIRVPAHFCGIFGHKPTRNVVPTDGHIPPPPGAPPMPRTELFVAGPLVRGASDLLLAMQVLGGPAGPEKRAYGWELSPARAGRLADYRIGYVLDDPYCPVSSDVKRVLEGAVEALQAAGARLEEGWPGGLELRRQFRSFYYLVSAVMGAPEDADLDALRRRAADQDGSPEAIRALAWTAPYSRYMEENHERRKVAGLWEEWFETHDAFLMPTAFVPAVPHDHSLDGWPNWEERRVETPEGPRRYGDLAVWVAPPSLTGHPATVAPVGRTQEGLPVGVQVLGPYLEDATSIDVAGRVSEVTAGYRPPPGYGR